MGKPLCSLLVTECTLPLLLMLLLSGWSSTCLSTDRLSFSIQLSEKRTGSEMQATDTNPSSPQVGWATPSGHPVQKMNRGKPFGEQPAQALGAGT